MIPASGSVVAHSSRHEYSRARFEEPDRRRSRLFASRVGTVVALSLQSQLIRRRKARGSGAFYWRSLAIEFLKTRTKARLATASPPAVSLLPMEITGSILALLHGYRITTGEEFFDPVVESRVLALLRCFRQHRPSYRLVLLIAGLSVWRSTASHESKETPAARCSFQATGLPDL